MCSRKDDFQTCEQQSEDNFKKLTQSNMQRSMVKGASSRKKPAGPQSKNLESALQGRWGWGHSA